MNSIGKRIKAARKNADMTQVDLAKATNLSRSYIGNLELDRYNPSVSALTLIANATHCGLEYLVASTNQPETQSSNGVKIPVLGNIIAGIPITAVEEIIDYEEIPESMAKTGEYFGLKIKGNSMEPRMLEGDVVIVKKQPCVESGDIAIVLVNGDEATIKKVKMLDEGMMLIANNQTVYEPHYYSNKDIKELPVQILGKVVELRGKF